MNLLLLPFKGLWFFFCIFVGCIVLSFMPIPEVPTANSSEEVSVSVEEEEGVYVSKEVMDILVELYYHHMEEHHHREHHHKEHQYHQREVKPSQNLL